jgi:KDO2-lipid IV(A) lauroyltransferase
MFDYVLYKIGQFITLRLPLKTAYKIAEFFSDIHYIFADKDRAAVKANLKTIFPEKSDRKIRQIRIRMFRNFAKYLVDFFRYEKIDKEYIKNNLKVENLHYFEEALSLGKGIIVLSAHLGNWELGGVLISLLGYDLWVVALEHKYKKINDFFNAQRKSKGIKVIPFNKAVRQSINILKENRLLALVGDKDFTKEGGIVINFFGKATSFPKGPAALSLKTGAAIIPGFMIRNEDDSFTLKIHPPINSILREEKLQRLDIKNSFTKMSEKDLQELTNRYKVIIEDYIKKYPEQWYMFREFWVK